MRQIVIDWLVDVHRKFKMKTETFFVAIRLLDRYLEINQIRKEIFQLVATACLFIAAKYEEIYPPSLSDFAYICADTYNKTEIIEMESMILVDLNFNLVMTSPFVLLSIYALESM
jgi:G2/mitotic-specific cyclin-B, other